MVLKSIASIGLVIITFSISFLILSYNFEDNIISIERETNINGNMVIIKDGTSMNINSDTVSSTTK